MTKMNPKVDGYFVEGCGRCPLGGTPDCKVHRWEEELALLRMIVLECGLKEELKWSHPCYTVQDKNVILLGAFNDACTISFLKGALLHDPDGILKKPGENSQAARLIRFKNIREIEALEPTLKAFILEAVEVEKAGLKVDFAEKTKLVLTEEFQQKLDEDPTLNAAFYALAPGRQRGYHLYFSAPKQSKTRESRIEKYIPQILAGKGFHEG